MKLNWFKELRMHVGFSKSDKVFNPVKVNDANPEVVDNA